MVMMIETVKGFVHVISIAEVIGNTSIQAVKKASSKTSAGWWNV